MKAEDMRAIMELQDVVIFLEEKQRVDDIRIVDVINFVKQRISEIKEGCKS